MPLVPVRLVIGSLADIQAVREAARHGGNPPALTCSHPIHENNRLASAIFTIPPKIVEAEWRLHVQGKP